MARLTRAEALATAEAVLRSGTPLGRKRLAKQFARELLRAIEVDRCTDRKFCARLILKTWRRVGLIR